MDTGGYSEIMDSLLDRFINKKIAIEEKLKRNISPGKREKLEYQLKVINDKIHQTNKSFFK